MALVTVSDATLTDIANAIRSKNGQETLYKPSQMPDAIEAISGGSTPVINSLSVTENGTYTAPTGVDGYSPITVNVPSSSPSLGTKSITENGTYNASSDSLDGYSSVTVNVAGNDNLPTVISNGTLDNYSNNSITNLRTYAFYYYEKITSFSSTSVTTVGGAAFRSCTGLTSVSLPNWSNASYGGDIFNGCNKLVTAMFPKLSSMNSGGNFAGCSKLETADLGLVPTVKQNTFLNCTKLTTLVLRKTTVQTLENVNAFSGTPFKSGGTGGTIYIPEVLYNALGTGTNDYKATSNWSTVDGYGTITWAKIEGSIYELS